jgi:hypothetical protein
VDITVTSGAAPKAGLYQRGDLIFHWKRFGKIEPDADE